jgi:enoyl-CoA hydratase/carnithine racemase
MTDGRDQLAVDWSGPVEASAVTVHYAGDGVAVLTLGSVPLGVLRQAVKRAIREALLGCEADPAVRALIITGSGRAFSVGSDVKEFVADPAWLGPAARVDQGLNLMIEGSRLPVIAALNGLTLGGGLELALACDVRMAAASARLGLPEVVVGAFASAGGTQRLPRLVGPGRALELLFTGRTLDAPEAQRIGLVEDVVPDAELLPQAIALARAIASMPVPGVAATKRCVQVGLRDGRSAGHWLETELTVSVGLTEDAIEGQRAFIGKREAHFGSGTAWIAEEVTRRRTGGDGTRAAGK